MRAWIVSSRLGNRCHPLKASIVRDMSSSSTAAPGAGSIGVSIKTLGMNETESVDSHVYVLKRLHALLWRILKL